MAVRRLNYTGRRRIRQAEVRVAIHVAEDGRATFDAEVDLGSHGLPAEAIVAVEAYRQTSWMRFPFGTVAALSPPDNRDLAEFDTPEAVLFRVRVTSACEPRGLLLAEGDQIRPQSPEEEGGQRVPLLPVKPDSGLGQEVFRLDFSDRPLLLVNSRAGDWRALAKEPAFASMVYPAAFREILTRILYVERHFDSSDAENWRSQWLRYAGTLAGVTDPPSETEEEGFDDWIDEAVASFCRTHRMMDRFGKYWTGEAEP